MTVLVIFWVAIIAFGIVMYVVLDGFDLGVGMLALWMGDEDERDLAVSAILPYWDGNQTWLVFGSAALYGAFPKAFATLLPTLYIPLMVMALSLLFRGVAFEFRLKAKKSKRVWEWSLALGSFTATLMQGMILGAFAAGFDKDPVSGHLVAHWFSPFSLFCAIALWVGYMQLGANFLMAKTVGRLRSRAYRVANATQYALLIAAVVVSVWSPFLDPALMHRWLNVDHWPYLAWLPMAALFFWWRHHMALRLKNDGQPFWMTVGLFICCYIGFVISAYPYIVPRVMPVWEAGATMHALRFLSIGVVIMLPLLLFYTASAYRVFHGKVTEKMHY